MLVIQISSTEKKNQNFFNVLNLLLQNTYVESFLQNSQVLLYVLGARF